MHDAVSLELKGVLSACVISSGFLGQAEYQAQMLGVSELPSVFVRHPISTATYQELRGKAEESYQVALESIRTGPRPPPTWVRDGPQGCSS